MKSVGKFTLWSSLQYAGYLKTVIKNKSGGKISPPSGDSRVKGILFCNAILLTGTVSKMLHKHDALE